MKTERISKRIHAIRTGQAYSSHVVLGALLVVTILYATTIIT